MKKTNKKLSDLLHYVTLNVPFYSSLGYTELEMLPFITKKDIKKDYELFIDSSILCRDSLIEMLNTRFDINNYVIEKKVEKDYFLEWTTGSGGIPFCCLKHKDERKKESFILWKNRMKISRMITPDTFYPFIPLFIYTIKPFR